MHFTISQVVLKVYMGMHLLTYTVCVCVCVCVCVYDTGRRFEPFPGKQPSILLGDMIWVRVCTNIYMQYFQTLPTSKLQTELHVNEYEGKCALYIRIVTR